jgi:hypothetical protein
MQIYKAIYNLLKGEDLLVEEAPDEPTIDAVLSVIEVSVLTNRKLRKKEAAVVALLPFMKGTPAEIVNKISE